jgi:hypothetical protein
MKDYDNKSGLLTMAKQTQSNPILPAVAHLSVVAKAKTEAKAGKAKVMLKGNVSKYTIGLYGKICAG